MADNSPYISPKAGALLKTLLFSTVVFLYVATLSNNSGMDALDYAANIKWGNRSELFEPHHLIYNLPTWFIYRMLGMGQFAEAYKIAALINAIAAAILVASFYSFLSRNQTKSTALQWAVLLAVCSGLWRYATEAETYIIPTLLSFWAVTMLVGSHIKRQSWETCLTSGVLLTISCLFHQIAVITYISVVSIWLYYAVNGKNIKPTVAQIMALTLPAVLVPLVYAWVYCGYYGHALSPGDVIAYALTEFHNGGVNNQFSVATIWLSGINVSRLIINIMPVNLAAIRNPDLKSYLLIVGLCGTVVLTTAALWLCKTLIQVFGFNKINQIIITSGSNHNLWLVLAMAHLAFAIYSKGNIEFMVPVLAFGLCYAALKYHQLTSQPQQKTQKLTPYLWGFILSIFTFNLLAMALPNALTTNYPANWLGTKTHKEPHSLFLLNNPNHVQAWCYYNTGSIHFNTPNPYFLTDSATNAMRQQVNNALNTGAVVYTDIPNSKPQLGRSKAILSDNFDVLLKGYQTIVADSLFYPLGASNPSGYYYIYRVSQP